MAILNFNITQSLKIQWVIMVIIIILALILTSNLKTIPDKKQSIAEIFIEFIENLIKSNMGEKFKKFTPYIGTLFLFLLFMNLVGLIGLKPPTVDYSVTLGIALISFAVIQVYSIKKSGAKEYMIGYARPFWFLLPINIMERFVFPISLSLRLFGNMFAATIIMDLLYKALRGVNIVAQVGIPIPLHAYFDVFDGILQMFIFVMLTMINIKVISEH